MSQPANPPTAQPANPPPTGSLLRRTTPAAQPTNAPQAAPSAPNQPQAPAPAPARPSPFSPPKPVSWRIVSLAREIVRFDLDGLGDPFYRVLEKPLQVGFGQPASVSKAMQAGGDEVAQMLERLNAVWAEVNLRGAVVLYPWKLELRGVLAGRVPNDQDESEALYEDDKRTPPKVLRALDLLLVFNVLGRARAHVLLPNTPVSLEDEFLTQSLYSDDPRLVALARATGCIEEPLR